MPGRETDQKVEIRSLWRLSAQDRSNAQCPTALVSLPDAAQGGGRLFPPLRKVQRHFFKGAWGVPPAFSTMRSPAALLCFALFGRPQSRGGHFLLTALGKVVLSRIKKVLRDSFRDTCPKNGLFGVRAKAPGPLLMRVCGRFEVMAERVGFEPTERCRSAVFKTAAIDHSATSP